jgi:hypothetical protein
MKALSDDFYKALVPSERIRAAVSALARNDAGELERLKATCPTLCFRITDPAYSEAVARLFALMLTVEYEMACAALDFKMAGLLDPPEACAMQRAAMAEAAALRDAWAALLEEMGIDPADMDRSGPPRHPAVSALLDLSAGDADPEAVADFLSLFRDLAAA